MVVISITVVNKGPDALAGSKPVLWIITGMMAEKKVPMMSDNNTLIPTMVANRIGSSDKLGFNIINKMVTMNEIIDNNMPDNAADDTS